MIEFIGGLKMEKYDYNMVVSRNCFLETTRFF
jgi:hypothetical protein